MAGHVFISYRRDGAVNQRWAERIHERLAAEGFDIWRDERGIEPGQRWSQVIPPALDGAAMVLCVVSESLLESDWVDDELNYARQRQLLVVPLQVVANYQPPFHLTGVQRLDLHTDDADAWGQLIQLVARHAGNVTHVAQQTTEGTARDCELRYLDGLLYLQQSVAQLTPLYTELAGVERRSMTLARALPADLMPVSFRHARAGGADPRPGEGVRHSDVLAVFKDYAQKGVAPRLAILGEPGAGKSFSLRRLSAELATQALENGQAPLPLLVDLGKWTDPGESLLRFIRSQLGDLGRDWQGLLDSGRAYLMLDALNEIPTSQQAFKVEQIKPWLTDPRLAGLALSCRERDFVDDLRLEMDTLVIEPLDPPRIYVFVRRYLDVIDPANAADRGEAFFWRLASGDRPWVVERLRDAWRQTPEQGVEAFGRFWVAERQRDGGRRGDLAEYLGAVENDRRALLWMARNPYLLSILFGLYLEGRLPPHHERRAAVFARFVDDLLARERERSRDTESNAQPEGEKGLRESLSILAWKMQTFGEPTGPDSVQTTILLPNAMSSLNPAQFDHAQAASLIEARGQQVFFTHQLLQEYFAALGLKAQIDAGSLDAHRLWPNEKWWERRGWEEVVNTMGGLYVDEPDALIRWLGDANPEVLADSLLANGVSTDSSPLLVQKAVEWIARMTDPEHEPNPAARAALGRAVGKLNLDHRSGIGLDQRGLPDIDWVGIPAGPFQYGEENETRELTAFFIARYPVTHAQFQAFIDDGGYAEDAPWWKGLAGRSNGPEAARWTEPNRPRETVSWYEAMAFCRWMSNRLGYEVRLATEFEWEKAARGEDCREYPWGDGYRPGFASVNEKAGEDGPTYLEHTTAVGLYPQGASPYGVEDLAGNMWEWCLNEYEHPSETGPSGVALRALRGGSWRNFPRFARTWSRFKFNPDKRYNNIGFRVVCSSPISR